MGQKNGLRLRFQTSYHHHFSLHGWMVWGHPNNSCAHQSLQGLLSCTLHLYSASSCFSTELNSRLPFSCTLDCCWNLFFKCYLFALDNQDCHILISSSVYGLPRKVLSWPPRYLVVMSKIMYYPSNVLVLSWPGSCVHPWLTCPPCLSARRSERGIMTENHLMLYILSDHLRLARFSSSSDTAI